MVIFCSCNGDGRGTFTVRHETGNEEDIKSWLGNLHGDGKIWTAVEGKVVSWDMKPSVLVDGYERFGGTCFFHLQGEWLKKCVAWSCEMVVPLYRTERCYFAEGSYL